MSPIFDAGLYVGSTAASKVYLGATEVWSSAASDPYFNDTQVLLNFDGGAGSTSFTNFSSSGIPVIVSGNAIQSSTQVKFGASSAYFDGSFDAFLGLSYGGNAIPPELALSSGEDWTIENWAWYDSSLSAKYIWGVGNGFRLMLWPGDTRPFRFYRSTTTLFYPYISIPSNQWVHIACARESNVIRFFVNGTSIGSITNSSSMGSTTFELGRAGSSAYTGYIDDFRFTTNVARYTGNFTPPTAPNPLQ